MPSPMELEFLNQLNFIKIFFNMLKQAQSRGGAREKRESGRARGRRLRLTAEIPRGRIGPLSLFPPEEVVGINKLASDP